jgi:hypothetical protein
MAPSARALDVKVKMCNMAPELQAMAVETAVEALAHAKVEKDVGELVSGRSRELRRGAARRGGAVRCREAWQGEARRGMARSDSARQGGLRG